MSLGWQFPDMPQIALHGRPGRDCVAAPAQVAWMTGLVNGDMPMRSKVQAVTPGVWVIKTLATTPGETSGDFLDMPLGS